MALNELARQSTMAIEPLGDFEGQEVLEDSSQAAVEDVVDSRERIRLLTRAIADLPPNAPRSSSFARCRACRKRRSRSGLISLLGQLKTMLLSDYRDAGPICGLMAARWGGWGLPGALSGFQRLLPKPRKQSNSVLGVWA